MKLKLLLVSGMLPLQFLFQVVIQITSPGNIKISNQFIAQINKTNLET